MGIIAALLMFNCNLHFNQLGCVETHLSCIKTMSTIKVVNIGGNCLNYEQRLAASYLYCVETGGDISDARTDYADYMSMVDSLSTDQYGGFNLWEKPGYWEKVKKTMEQVKAN